MVITDADRFGLSTLHQLHGRVGRGDVQSYCVLESSGKAINRLQVMCDTTDGFKIAEADLKTRGAGDLIGTQQAGANRYVQLMLTHSDVYQRAQKEARFILKNNLSCPMLERIVRSDEQTVS